MDEIGPGEGRLDSGGIEIPLKPAGKGGVAQVPAGSPAQATTGGEGRKLAFLEVRAHPETFGFAGRLEG